MKFFCRYCGERFGSDEAYHRHLIQEEMVAPHLPEMFWCSHCTRWFKSHKAHRRYQMEAELVAQMPEGWSRGDAILDDRGSPEEN